MSIRILVVDDEENIREMSRLLLERKGYLVETAENGVAALQAIRQNRPQLILLDVLMPEMDGYTFYKELKKDKSYRDIPIIVITARGMMEDSFKVMGVDGFLSKPVLPQNLLCEIEHILTIYQIRDEEMKGVTKPVSKRILLIGRDRAVLEDMAFQARRLDFHCQIAIAGSEAVGTAVKFVPGIIFIDVLLEDMPPVEIVEILRRLPHFEDCPIVGYCYYGTENLDDTATRNRLLEIEGASQRLLRRGATHYMGRYNPRLFVQTIHEQAFRKKSS